LSEDSVANVQDQVEASHPLRVAWRAHVSSSLNSDVDEPRC
jgi:hypothetical protein